MIHYDSKEITPPLSSGCPRYSYGITGNRAGFKICLMCLLSLFPQRKLRQSKLPDHDNQDPKKDNAQNSLSGRNKGSNGASALRRGSSRRGGKPNIRLKTPQERGMTGVGVDGVVPHDLSSSRNLSEIRSGPDGAGKLPAAAIPGEPGSVDGAHQAPNSDFVPKCDIIGKDALSALHRAASQQCRQEIANIVCQHQAGQLMPESLPQFCPQLGENPLKFACVFIIACSLQTSP